MNFVDSPIWLEQKYASLVSSRLQLYSLKKSSPYQATFRCHVCGDSEKNRLKTRGYLFEHKSHLTFKCHNCGVSMGFRGFLKSIDEALLDEFRLECLTEANNGRAPDVYKPDIGLFTKPRFSQCNLLKPLKKISQLPLEHGARVYVTKRQIPIPFHHKLYYCPKFMTWVNHYVPGKFEEFMLKNDEPRLIIPFIDQNGYLFGFQGRSFKKKTDLRYVTIMLDETRPKIFGLDSLDKSKDSCILEGPIDSMFIPNSLAFAGADGSIESYVAKERAIILYDNEPRNEQICKKIFNAITHGYRVVIWPKHITGKDINDLVLSGMDVAEIIDVISKNTYSGLSAMIEFNSWKKVTI